MPGRRDIRAICLLAIICLCGCRFFPEAEFSLAPESRLPKWFILSEGLSRADVTVTMDTYAVPGSSATFTLRDARGRKLAQVDTKLDEVKPWLTVKEPPEVQYTQYSYYPRYDIATAKGASEVIEHREPGPVFYVNDDPAVRARLGLTANPNRLATQN
jgi:hypothetical protein